MRGRSRRPLRVSDVADEQRYPENVTIEAFGHVFTVLPGLAEHLITLEKEGALYSEFWDDATELFLSYRIRLLPQEIVRYVEAQVAMEEYHEARSAGADFEGGLAAISDEHIGDLVRNYEAMTRDGKKIDIRGCFASFLPADLEALVCGQRKDRYERLPDLGDGRSRLEIIRSVMTNFPVVARHLADRGRGRPAIHIENEYDVQDLLYASLRSIFMDTRFEDWTPQVAGKAKRIDLVVPQLDVVIETKMVRDRKHAHSIVDELMIDIESYHSHPNCKQFFAFVYDPTVAIADPDRVQELSGLRKKGDHTFEVHVVVRS